MIKYLCNSAAIWHLEMKLEIVCSIIPLEYFPNRQKMGAQRGTLFCWMRSLTRYTEMDCDGVIGETGVDNSDWVYSLVVEISQIMRGTMKQESKFVRKGLYKTLRWHDRPTDHTHEISIKVKTLNMTRGHQA
jgi:hypothetical protein